MSDHFYGRSRELKLLNELKEKRIASLVVLKGRRRVGKSRLAEEFGRTMRTITLVGLPPENREITAEIQRKHFLNEMEREIGIRGLKADDWDDLFWHLAQNTQKGRVLVILDEINWMGSKDPTFLGKLKTAWDKYFKKNPQLIMILSGSMSGWIDRNIMNSTGFFGRVSLDMTLEELPLYQCSHFWKPRGKLTSAYEKFKVLSVTGGIPRYLEEIDPKLSAEDIVYRLCFRKEGFLYKEFKRIFSDLFGRRTETYKRIVSVLAHSSCDYQQICQRIGIEKGGVISEYLEDLVATQYLSRDYIWNLKSGEKSKLSKYRLKDNYLRFYLRYIEPNADAIEKGRLRRPPGWDSIMGLQFENLVTNHFFRLYHLLGIPVEEIINDGPYFQRKTSQHEGCQVDYLVQTKYKNLYLCEIKFSLDLIGAKVIEEIQSKIDRLHTPGVNYSYRPVLIHVKGVTEEVQKSGFFTHIIDFGQLLQS